VDEISGGWEPRRHRISTRRVGVAAAAGLGITLGAAGIAAAASSPTPSPSAGASSQATPPRAAPQPGHRQGPGGRLGRERGFGLMGAVHGEFVVPDGTGWRTVAVQRGVVTAVSSTSLTVTSKDGYAKTYVITAQTLVNAARDGIASVKKDENVAVMATVVGATATATDVRDLTKLKEQRRQWGPPPGGRPGRRAPAGTPASPSSYDAGADAVGA
jgi:hypothetical protein